MLNICFLLAPIEESEPIYFFFSFIEILKIVYIKAIDDTAIIAINSPTTIKIVFSKSEPSSATQAYPNNSSLYIMFRSEFISAFI